MSACSSQPSDNAIQTAIHETQSSDADQISIPTTTYTQEPTATPSPIPTDTLTPVPTSSPTPIPTQSPTPDIRIIGGDPEDYILVPEDLPDKFILSRGNSTPHLNSEILSARGVEDGKKYLDATGRIGGWIIWYYRASEIPIAPDWIQSYIVMYDSVEGPVVAKSDEYDWVDEDWEILDMDLDLGDWNRVSIFRERQSSGKYYVWYAIEFHYKNVWSEVLGQGLESDVQHEYIEDAALAVLEKLQEAPLSAPPLD